MRKLLAIFFITIFSFQILPMKEIGKLLFKAQTTEEVHEDHADDDAGFQPLKLKKEGDPFGLVSQYSIVARVKDLSLRISLVIHRSAMLPDYHIPDILTPPPNFC